MKNTLILTVEQLAIYYRESMMAHLSDTQNDLHPREFADELVQLGSTLKGMTSTNNELALGTFRQEFAAGYTMMMMEDKEFDRLEEMSKNDEDFQIALFREDGSAVGIVKKKDVNW